MKTKENNKEDKWLRPGEAADILNVHQETIRRYSRQGIIRCQRTTGKHRRYLFADVDRVKKMQMLGESEKDIKRYLDNNELANFFYVLSMTLESGMMLSASFSLACEVSESYLLDKESDTRKEIETNLKNYCFYQALEKSQLFPKLSIALVKAGEESGTLERVCKRIYEYFKEA